MFGDTVAFDGSESSDNFAIESYMWTLNDGIEDVVLYGVGPEHTFNEPGNYTVTLTVTDTSGNSDQDTMYVNVSGEKIPSPPTGLTISEIGEDYFILVWNAPTTNTDGSELTNLKNYYMYRSAQSGGPYTKIATLITWNELYRDAGLLSGFTGYYVVTAVNSEGRESEYSNEAWARIPEKGSISGSIIDDTGDPVPGALIELKKNGTRELAIQSNEKGNFTIVGLDDGTYEVVISKKGYYTTTKEVTIKYRSTVILDGVTLESLPEPPTEVIPTWMIILILLIAILIPVGIIVVLAIKRRKSKKEDKR